MAVHCEFSEEESVNEDFVLGAKPYVLEPPYKAKIKNKDCSSEEESSNSENGEENVRIGDRSWCVCGCCDCMPSEKESVCCAELGWLQHKREERQCVTEHPEFSSLLMPGILKMMSASMEDLRGQNRRENWTERYVYFF